MSFLVDITGTQHKNSDDWFVCQQHKQDMLFKQAV